MNRYKRFQYKKYREKRVGLTAHEIEKLDDEEKDEMEFLALIKHIHLGLFEEEYDFMLDSHADVQHRRNGNNPMSQDYIEAVEQKRTKFEISQLSRNGFPPLSMDSWEIVHMRALEGN